MSGEDVLYQYICAAMEDYDVTIEDIISEEFCKVMDEYLAAENEEVVKSLLGLREDIFKRLGIGDYSERNSK